MGHTLIAEIKLDREEPATASFSSSLAMATTASMYLGVGPACWLASEGDKIVTIKVVEFNEIIFQVDVRFSDPRRDPGAMTRNRWPGQVTGGT